MIFCFPRAEDRQLPCYPTEAYELAPYDLPRVAAARSTGTISLQVMFGTAPEGAMCLETIRSREQHCTLRNPTRQW